MIGTETSLGHTTPLGVARRRLGSGLAARVTSMRRWFGEHKLAFVASVVIVLLMLFSFVGPLVYHTDQVHTHMGEVHLRPSWAHPLGTDDVGYDVLGRLMAGGQSSLEVGLAAALLASIFGTFFGAVAGYAGGWLDALMMRVLDSFLAIPALLVVLLLATVFTASVPMLILVLGLVSWLLTARLVRGDTLSLRTREFVAAARAAGARRHRILVRHIIPNALGTIVVQTTFEVANAILLLAGLSYLGLGPPPPSANWGSMLSSGLNYLYDGYWWLIYPAGALIVLTVLAFNFLAEALRDSFEQRLSRR